MADTAPALAAVLSDIARLAGRELAERFPRARTIEKKAATDLVTDADRASEALVVGELQRRFPGAAIQAEESGVHAGSGRHALRFIVDPLDGTTNYAHGVPLFSVTLAATDEAGLLAGVTYDPLRDELFAAARGGGATLNGKALHVGHAAALGEALVATGFPYDWTERAEQTLALFGDVARQARGMRRFGSAALDLAWVAAGRFDAYFERGLKPWDVAAGVLLVNEAGGTTTDYRGHAPELAHGEVVASNPALQPSLVACTSRHR